MIKKMKFAVVGLGSMGCRRIRLLQLHFPEIEVIAVDLADERRESAQEQFKIKTATSLEQAVKGHGPLTASLVCTSPISHELIIKNALSLGLNVFTEINLLNNYYSEVIKTAENKNLKLYLSSTLLHREEIEFIQNKVLEDKAVTYRYHVGQYLPDWHPWESYKDFFVADKRTNGCREIFAIELPWIIKTFGQVESMSVEKQKISSLEIDYPDTYNVLFKHETGICGSININVVSRVAKRELDIIGEQTQISWKGTPDSLTKWNSCLNEMELVPTYASPIHQSGYASNILENAYLSELSEFIDLLTGKISQTRYSFNQDMHIIDLINNIEAGL